MKKLVVCTLVLCPILLAHAQIKSGRHYAEKTGVTKTPPAPPMPPSPAPAQPAQSANGATKTAPAVRQKTADEKQEILARTIEHQRKRAEAGNDVAQYDYGMRFLRGEGVDKNLETARKWLELSAKQGNSLAKKQLEALNNKPATEPDKTK